MTIGIDASRAQLAQKTGTEWYSFRLIQELKKIPTDHRILLYTKKTLTGDLGKLPRNYENKVLHWPPKYLWTQLRLMWEMLVHPPDVLFSPAHAAPILSRAKIVITIHDVGFTALPHLYSWKDKIYHKFSTWWNCKFAQTIIAPSEFTKSELIKFYKVDADKVKVVYHGAPEPPPPTNVGDPSLFKEGRQVYLLFVGRLEKKKNILNIIKAFEIVKKAQSDLKLILAGRPGFGFEEIKDYLYSSEYKDSIEIKGYVTEEEKWQLYSNAQALLFPTLYEGFGIPILEAQSVGCPVITSNGGANMEIAGEGAVLVDPLSSKSISCCIFKTLDDKLLKGEMIRKGRQNLNRFSWINTSKQTFAVLTNQQ